ncbi:MAG TPA: diguanylate cyclase, partial [Desulfobacterales bacterium]|nr:diguanylate cyclase [Desulfobacterales bacterium]
SAPLELVAQRAELIRKMVDEELRLEYNEHKFHVTISMGAACYPDHGEPPDRVLKAADNALYQAKENGRNQVARA